MNTQAKIAVVCRPVLLEERRPKAQLSTANIVENSFQILRIHRAVRSLDVLRKAQRTLDDRMGAHTGIKSR